MNIRQKYKSCTPREAGFSFLEMLIVLTVLSLLAVQQLSTTALNSADTISNAMVEKVQRVQRASMRFYRASNAWPANAGVLVSTGYLRAGEEVDSWGTTFAVTVVGQDLSVATDVKELKYVSRIQGKLPRASVSGTTVTSLIDKPGEEAAHDALYSLDGSKALTGPMNANGQNINSAGLITAQRYNDVDHTGYYVDPGSSSVFNVVDTNYIKILADAAVGSSCTTKSIGTTSTGKFVACEGGVWKTPGNELPVGSIYISTTTTNPSILLGYGIWASFGAGRVLVSQNTSDAAFDVMEETGGAKTHTLTVNEMPSHTHSVTTVNLGQIRNSGSIYNRPSGKSNRSTGSAGGSAPHNNLQPYITVKMWKRTG